MDSSSVGIIGGADGPTAIFITKNVFPWAKLGLIALLLIVVSVVIYFNKK